MQRIKSKLTVYFDSPFWVGVYEIITDGKIEVSKITFGEKPKDYEVHSFILKNYRKLEFSTPIEVDQKKDVRKINPKRRLQKVKKQIQNIGIGTKAQEAIKLQQMAGKEAKKKRRYLKRLEEQKRKFTLKQEKKKQKHKGH